MRVVLANYCDTDEPGGHPAPTGRQYDLLCCGEEAPDIRWDKGHVPTYAQIAAHFPTGWKPDVYIHWSVEFHAIPKGLEEADCLTVGVVGDWHVGAQAYQKMGGAFDMLFADRVGCERLHQAGFSNVYYAPLYGYLRHRHRLLPNVNRDLDVVMIGNLHYDVHRERSRRVARILQLADRFKILITGGIFGEEYVRLMNRARIVFNRSLRGEINHRAYQAAACGALLFYERENPEIRNLFTDRQECVLYGDDDLEDLLTYYLTHEDERQQVAEAGWKQVQGHTCDTHLAQILEQIEAAHAAKPHPKSRSLLDLPTDERLLRSAYQSMVVTSRVPTLQAEQTLKEAQEGSLVRPEVANARACALAGMSEMAQDSNHKKRLLAEARIHAQNALTLQPDYVVARFNLAHFELASGDRSTAESELKEMIRLLQADNIYASQFHGPYYPRRFNLFDVELERIWNIHTAESKEWTAAMRLLLLWRGMEELSALAHDDHRSDEAIAYAAEAVAWRPDLAPPRHRLAKELWASGRCEEAEIEYRRVIEEAPLIPELLAEYATILYEIGRIQECLAVIEKTRIMTQGCPMLNGISPVFDKLEEVLEITPPERVCA